ncbi:MAG TPA: class I SAM-dependent methyltransferase [Allosphingosinicella sp.]|nr:class I SAM-dependent methyltransferase [Allosphingosinicella sp.]
MENSAMNERIIGLYEDHAAAWDAMRGDRARLEAPWLERFVALLPAGGRVLDIGCGSGRPVAAWLIDRGLRVTGIDSSPSLIALARGRFPKAEWQVADMRALALGERFDGLIAWHGLFHLSPDDQRPMFGRLAAHAKPGAALMFTSGWGAGVRIGEWQGEPLYHASLDPAEYRRLLGDNGFKILEHKRRDPECGEASVWIARYA